MEVAKSKIEVTYDPFQPTCPAVGSQVKGTDSFWWWWGDRARTEEYEAFLSDYSQFLADLIQPPVA